MGHILIVKQIHKPNVVDDIPIHEVVNGVTLADLKAHLEFE